jgi:peptide/nickel transport system substrate-binding protein
MRKKTRSFRGALALAAVVTIVGLTVGGCGAAGFGQGGTPTEITVAQVDEPKKTAEPIRDGSLVGYSLYYGMFDALTILDKDGKITPRLATDWEPSPDMRTWTFHVRDGIKFTNGDPLTARDVAFTYNTILDTPDSDTLAYMKMVGSVEAPDDSTVVFHLDTPFSPFPSITSAVSIVPEKVYREVGSEEFARHPVGSGPYKFAGRTVGVDYTLKRNDDYWGEKGQYEKITFQTIADDDARLNGVLSSSLDVALIAPYQAASVNGIAKLESQESNGVTFFGMNSSKGPLAKKEIRQAVEAAIDKNAIVDYVLDGRASVATQMIAPKVAGYDDSMKPSEFNVDKAKALLKAGGYNGEPITLTYATDGRIPLSSEISQVVQEMLGDAGINVKMEGIDQSTLTERIYTNKDMDGIYLNTYAPSQMDGDPVVESMFAGDKNDYAMRDETKELVEKTRSTSGQDRVKAYGELMRYNADNALLIPLFVPESNYAVNKNVDFQPRADDLSVFSPMTGSGE